jgi:hypothetical protein
LGLVVQQEKEMPRPRLYASDAERVAACRARKNTVRFCVDLPADLVEELEAFLKFKDVTKKDTIEKLIRTQLLRKR